MNTLNGHQFREMLISGANNLANHQQEVDALNVFPVPDGDTGTNMTLTIISGIQSIERFDDENVSEIAKIFSKGLLMGARGNSGVILSQIFRGISKSLSDNVEIEPHNLAYSLFGAEETAYKAVMKPVEGTILTVIRETSEVVNQDATAYTNFEELFEIIVSASNKSLDNTPNLLPVLKEVGVVDSGGAGLVYIFEGMQSYILGTKIERLSQDIVESNVQSEIEHDEFGYCTEFIISLDDERLKQFPFTEDNFRTDLSKYGNSIVVVMDEDIVKVHIHTETPGRVLNLGQKYGEFLKLKIENMAEQHNELIAKGSGHTSTMTELAKKEKQKYALIAVSPSEGINELFEGFGVEYIISGGQTMNPSTEDFIKLIDEANAENVIILPNNSNIIMAAEQASEVAEDVNVAVVKTKSIPQGLAASSMFSEGLDIDDNVEEMTEIITDVKTGQVTYAIRNTTMDDVEITEGDYMGIYDKKIVVSVADKLEASTSLIDQMIDEDNELITLIVGEDVTDEEQTTFLEYIEEKFEDVEVECHQGGQQVYSFIIGVE